MDDRTLQQDVIAEVNFIPNVDAADIGVTAENGVVTLSGHVPSYVQKLAIERAVSHIRGVKAIAQEIIVRYPDAKKTADDEIAKRIVDIFTWDADVPEDKVAVSVSHGWVTLTGEVDWFYQRRAAESDVRKLGGVVSVTNHIVISSAFQPSNVKVRIEQALKRNAEVKAENILVIVQGDKVILKGTIDMRRQREVAAGAAWSVPGVRSVDDQLAYV